MKRLAIALVSLLLASPLTAQDATYPNSGGAGGGGGGAPSFPLAAPCGTAGAPSYSFTAFSDMGMWCTDPAGALILQSDGATNTITMDPAFTSFTMPNRAGTGTISGGSVTAATMGYSFTGATQDGMTWIAGGFGGLYTQSAGPIGTWVVDPGLDNTGVRSALNLWPAGVNKVDLNHVTAAGHIGKFEITGTEAAIRWDDTGAAPAGRVATGSGSVVMSADNGGTDVVTTTLSTDYASDSALLATAVDASETVTATLDLDMDPGFSRNGYRARLQIEETGNALYKIDMGDNTTSVRLHAFRDGSNSTGYVDVDDNSIIDRVDDADDVTDGQVSLGGTTWSVNLDGLTDNVDIDATASGGSPEVETTVTDGTLTGVFEYGHEGKRMTNTGTQPTCAVGLRGREWRTAGAAGAADSYQRCEKDANDDYAWRDLANPPAPFQGTWTDGGNTLIATITGTAAGDSGGGRMDYHFITLDSGGDSVQAAQECFFSYRNSTGDGVVCSASPGDGTIRQTTGTIVCDCSCLVSSSDVLLRADCNTSGITEVSFDASGRVTVFGYEGVAPDLVYP